jgi:gamma-glutamyltranspeptidase/glutathione hydrolase
VENSAENLRPADLRYASRRMPVVASRGIVATSEPLAAQAGLHMLQSGGNAVDAAIATAITLTVVEPTANGIGADAFALVWDGARLHGLNGSGRASARHSLALYREQGLTSVPDRGWHPVTVPGAPAAWREVHERFGRLPFARLFEPAIYYAEHGFPVGPVTAWGWAAQAAAFAETNQGREFRAWFSTFAPHGRAPRPGEIFAAPDQAMTLRRIAESGAEDFYHGELAGRIVDFAAETGGYLSRADLAGHTGTWVTPINTNYRGYDIWEIPPNGQGITVLNALAILADMNVAATARETAESYHLQIEALKLSFADTLRYVADPDHVAVPVTGLLDPAYAAQRRRLIGDKALDPVPGSPPHGGTVYLCTADGDGMMVSFIQSNYRGFGSGIVVPGTGIALQNRGAGFVLDPEHPNCVAPGKRPYHTIIPAFLTLEGRAIGPFGVMGGYMQPQGHLQMVINQLDYGMDPQSSLDAPRWQWVGGRKILLEAAVPGHVVAGLEARGHEITIAADSTSFGRGQIIRRLASGALMAGSEPRADGCAMGY